MTTNEYNYSIIIPHKNIPKLLERCLASIPIRKDVQVIIVDDSSDASVVDFTQFPGKDRDYTEVYFTHENKGAGYARNVGLNYAKGKWVIFADSDDMFSTIFPELLDKYVDYKEDIIFFERKVVMSDDTNMQADRASCACIQNYIMEDTSINSNIRWYPRVVWARFYSHQLIKDNDIRFQEIKWSNDNLFQAKAGVLADSILVSNEVMYILTVRQNSLAYLDDFHKTTEELVCRTKAGMDMHCFLKNSGYTIERFIFIPYLNIILSRKRLFTFIRLIKYADQSIIDELSSQLLREARSLKKKLALNICLWIAYL